MKKITSLISFLVLYSVCNGQEPFFSQFYNASYSVNPAFTGTAYGYVRAGVNYKNYFNDFDQVQTMAAFTDMSLLENDRNPDYAGVGAVIIRDQSGKVLNNTRAMLSFSYHNAFGRARNEFLAFGLQAGVDNTSIDFSGLTTQNQWVSGQGLDITLPTGELMQGDNATVLDFNAGLMWYKFLRNGTSFIFGGSVYHLSQPDRNFLGGENPINRRYAVHGSAKLPLKKSVNIAPSLFYFYQSGKHIINPGAAVEFELKNKAYVSTGAWLRNLDVAIGMIQLEYNSLIVAASYDLLLSSIADNTRNGGLEVSVSYLFERNYKKRTRIRSNTRPRI